MPFRTIASVLLAAGLTACSGSAPPPRPHSDTHNDGVVVYSEKSDFVVGLACGAGHLYVLDDLVDSFAVRVMALSTTDGSARTLAKVPDDMSYGGIVVDGGYVYFRTMSAVYRVPSTAGPVETLLEIPDGSESPALAVDGDELYLGSPSRYVLLGAMPKNGGALTELARDPQYGGNHTRSIAITPTHVWVAFADTSWGSLCILGSCSSAPQHDTDLLRYTKSDGSVFFDASNKNPWLVAAQNGYVYFDSRYRLVRMPDQGGEPDRIMESVDLLQLDGRSAFWAEDSNGDVPAGVGRLDLVTGDTHSYAVEEFHPSVLAVDATDVYWEADGKVYRAAR